VGSCRIRRIGPTSADFQQTRVCRGVPTPSAYCKYTSSGETVTVTVGCRKTAGSRSRSRSLPSEHRDNYFSFRYRFQNINFDPQAEGPRCINAHCKDTLLDLPPPCLPKKKPVASEDEPGGHHRCITLLLQDLRSRWAPDRSVGARSPFSVLIYPALASQNTTSLRHSLRMEPPSGCVK
jgi:hypothetical protein